MKSLIKKVVYRLIGLKKKRISPPTHTQKYKTHAKERDSFPRKKRSSKFDCDVCVLLPTFCLYRVCFGSWNSHNIVVARSFMVQHTRDGPLFVYRGILVWNPIVFLGWLALFPLFLFLSIPIVFVLCVFYYNSFIQSTN